MAGKMWDAIHVQCRSNWLTFISSYFSTRKLGCEKVNDTESAYQLSNIVACMLKFNDTAIVEGLNLTIICLNNSLRQDM